MFDKKNKKDKKKEQRKRNLRAQLTFEHLRIHREQQEQDGGLAAPEIAKEGRSKERSKKDQEQLVWSAKVQMIRNRLDSSRRAADERWNRFAGTEDGGGRGR